MQRCATVAALLAATAFTACGGTDDKAAVRIDLTGFQNLLYAAPLTIGGQTFTVQVDTGSTTAAVAGSNCASCFVTPAYTPGATAKDTGQTGSTTYGDGSMWSGEIFADTANVATSPDVQLDFVSITSQTMYFQGNAYQGILGLGPSDLLDPHTTSFATQTFAKGLDAELAFELCGNSGTMFIGGFDDTLAASAPTFTAMLPIGSTGANGFYAVELASLGLGSAAFATGSAAGTPIVDTGTSLTYLPTGAFNALVSALNASPGFTTLFAGQQIAAEGCVTQAGVTDDMVDAMVPALTVSFAGNSGVVSLAPSRTFLTASGVTAGQYCLTFDDAGSLGAPASFSVLGDSFMSGALTVFDIANNRVGFAPDVGCTMGSGSAAVAPATAPHAPGRPWWDGSPYFRPPPLR
jgi:hypothetical protein